MARVYCGNINPASTERDLDDEVRPSSGRAEISVARAEACALECPASSMHSTFYSRGSRLCASSSVSIGEHWCCCWLQQCSSAHPCVETAHQQPFVPCSCFSQDHAQHLTRACCTLTSAAVQALWCYQEHMGRTQASRLWWVTLWLQPFTLLAGCAWAIFDMLHLLMLGSASTLTIICLPHAWLPTPSLHRV